MSSMEPYNYEKKVLVKKSDDSRFKDSRVRSCIVVGIACEDVLVLHHRSELGLPKPVEAQLSSDHTQVRIHQVKTPEKTNFRSVWVHAFPRDARLAISVIRRVLERLKNTEWELVPVNAVYANPKLEGGVAHDIICRAVRGGAYKGKLFSVELKCKEVDTKNPAGFSWKEEVEGKADALWTAELQLDPQPWAARIVVFCEMACPCHSGEWSLHASVRFGDRPWRTLWGWQGFSHSVSRPLPKASSRAAVRPPSAAPKLPARPATRPSPAVRASPPTAQELERGWTRMLASMSGPLTHEGDWVKIATFLDKFGQPVGHPGRHLEEGEGTPGKLWLLGPSGRRKPREGVDYARRSGKRGGGAGSVGARRLGPFWGRVSFLRDVALKYFPQKLA
jgi:hypothetical protein